MFLLSPILHSVSVMINVVNYAQGMGEQYQRLQVDLGLPKVENGLIFNFTGPKSTGGGKQRKPNHK